MKLFMGRRFIHPDETLGNEISQLPINGITGQLEFSQGTFGRATTLPNRLGHARFRGNRRSDLLTSGWLMVHLESERGRSARWAIIA